MMKSKHGRRHASGGERNAQYKEELCEILRRIVDKGLAEIEGTMREIERLEVERRQLVLLLEIARLSSGSRPACEFGTN